MRIKTIYYFLSITLVIYFSCSEQLSDNTDKDWEEIQQCIAGMVIDYESGLKVNDQNDVEAVFNNYIQYSKINDQDIFGHGTNWIFNSTEKHGVYERTKYWKILASWYSEEDQIWRQKEVFDVSENGEVVRLLGCI